MSRNACFQYCLFCQFAKFCQLPICQIACLPQYLFAKLYLSRLHDGTSSTARVQSSVSPGVSMVGHQNISVRLNLAPDNSNDICVLHLLQVVVDNQPHFPASVLIIDLRSELVGYIYTTLPAFGNLTWISIELN